jgi:hypothetical protein
MTSSSYQAFLIWIPGCLFFHFRVSNIVVMTAAWARIGLFAACTADKLRQIAQA